MSNGFERLLFDMNNKIDGLVKDQARQPNVHQLTDALRDSMADLKRIEKAHYQLRHSSAATGDIRTYQDVRTITGGKPATSLQLVDLPAGAAVSVSLNGEEAIAMLEGDTFRDEIINAVIFTVTTAAAGGTVVWRIGA